MEEFISMLLFLWAENAFYHEEPIGIVLIRSKFASDEGPTSQRWLNNRELISIQSNWMGKRENGAISNSILTKTSMVENMIPISVLTQDEYIAVL